MYNDNIVAMVGAAGIVVKIVLTLLLFASILCWAIICKKFFQLRRTRRESRVFLEAFWKSRTLSDAYLNTKDLRDSSVARVFRMGYNELIKFGKLSDPSQKSPESRKGGFEGGTICVANVERALRKGIESEISRLSQTLSILATTGNTAPFVGLFGTVWGIMTAFQGIGLRGSASLATVAPGISEALVATATGLAAAIPAVIAYNYCLNIIRRIESDMHGFAIDLSNLVEREFVLRLSSRSGIAQASEAGD
ncbi:MAG: protein TolQ [Pseudomonadota bacterium]